MLLSKVVLMPSDVNVSTLEAYKVMPVAVADAGAIGGVLQVSSPDLIPRLRLGASVPERGKNGGGTERDCQGGSMELN